MPIGENGNQEEEKRENVEERIIFLSLDVLFVCSMARHDARERRTILSSN